MVLKDGPVTQLADLTFIDADARGLKGPVIRFELKGVEPGSFHPDMVAFLDQALGPAKEPELPTSGGIEPTGRAKQMLGWVYAACLQGNWPVFQEGVFDPAGDSDLAGCYHLPTRVGPRMLPFQLFQVLLKWLLHPNPSNGKEGISAALAPLQAQFKRHALMGSNCRWVMLRFHQAGYDLTEIGNDIYQIGSGRDARFVRGTVDEQSSELLTWLQGDKEAMASFLQMQGIPTVENLRTYNRANVIQAADRLGYPVVFKPFNGTQSKDVFINLNDRQDLETAISRYSGDLRLGLVEKYVPGESLRIFVIGETMLWCVSRLYQYVVGDGKTSLDGLIRAYAVSEYEDPVYSKVATTPEFFFKKFQIREFFTEAELGQVVPDGERIKLFDLPSGSFGMMVADYTEEHFAEDVLEQIKQLGTLFRGTPLGIDALGEREDGQFRHLVFNEVNTGPQVTRDSSQKVFMERWTNR